MRLDVHHRAHAMVAVRVGRPGEHAHVRLDPRQLELAAGPQRRAAAEGQVVDDERLAALGIDELEHAGAAVERSVAAEARAQAARVAREVHPRGHGPVAGREVGIVLVRRDRLRVLVDGRVVGPASASSGAAASCGSGRGSLCGGGLGAGAPPLS
jgi:hypothetical protein